MKNINAHFIKFVTTIHGILLTSALIGFLGANIAQCQPIQLFQQDANVTNLKNFWIKIFTQHSDEQTIVHDKTDPNLFYETIEHPGMEHFTRKRLVERTEKKIAATLKVISFKLGATNGKNKKKNKLNGASLTKYEKQLISCLPKKKQKDASFIKKLATNVRSQQGMSNRVRDGIDRSMLYLDYVRSEFTNAGLPEDLAYLPHVESSFNYKAYSRVGAAGIWQFMPVTAKFYKLKVSKEVDERLDPIKSTKAAVKLLKDNYRQLDSWPLAITGYNHGVNSMRKAVKKFGTNDYSKIFLSYNHDTFEFASKNFYPSFLAAVEVAKSPDKFFTNMSANQKSPLIGPMVLDHSLRLADILTKFKISRDVLKQFNPHIMSVAFKRNSQIPKGVNIYIPNAQGDGNNENDKNKNGGDLTPILDLEIPREYSSTDNSVTTLDPQKISMKERTKSSIYGK